jgi:DNA-binding response OmpR family regulator
MPKKILVVDDEPDIVKIIKDRLITEEFEVETAYDGQEAMEKYYKTSPDLIVLDIIMPKIDGYELCQMIKANPDKKSIPIVMLTAKTELKNKENGFSRGADAYLTKPVDMEELIKVIKQVLSS